MTRQFVFELCFPGKDFDFFLVYHMIDIVQSVTSSSLTIFNYVEYVLYSVQEGIAEYGFF